LASSKKRSSIAVDFFISNEQYVDQIIYQLAQDVSDEMQMPLSEVLISLGEYLSLKPVVKICITFGSPRQYIKRVSGINVSLNPNIFKSNNKSYRDTGRFRFKKEAV
jgi:hypothetical protein